ncbi:MAG: UDP-glucose 4-epimerase, partial [Solibacillus sp.]
EENKLLEQKCMIEQMLEVYTKAYDMNGIVLRYCKSTNKNVQATDSESPEDTISGNRGFNNVTDVANAHVLVLEALERGELAYKMYDLSAVSSENLQQELDWQAERNVHEMIEDAWNWHENSKC